jgi:hypothetical protein
MRFTELSTIAQKKTDELDENGLLLIIDDIAVLFRDSFSIVKTINLTNEECSNIEKCMLFVEYYLIHSDKSKFLFFTLFDIIEGDGRFDMIRTRLKLMNFPNNVNNIQNDWRKFLKESILCAKELYGFGKSELLSDANTKVFFERSITKVMSNFRKMLRQINEENNLMQYLIDLMIVDKIVEEELASKLLRISTSGQNRTDLYNFL